MGKVHSKPYLWLPGKSFDYEALARIKGHFSVRPKGPMGEAWFMSEERMMFVAAMEGPRESIKIADLNKWLFEIASGLRSFGYEKEWDDWFHYLLPMLIERAQEPYAFHYLYESTVTCFLNLHWVDIREPYKGFQDDALATLGQTVMRKDVWKNDWKKTGGDLSAALIFCIKYLKPEQVGPWADSVLAIEAPEFRMRLFEWLCAIYPFLKSSSAKPSEFDNIWPQVSWESSHALEPEEGKSEDFLPAVQREEFCATVSRILTIDEIETRCEKLSSHEEIFEYSKSGDLFTRLFEALF